MKVFAKSVILAAIFKFSMSRDLYVIISVYQIMGNFALNRKVLLNIHSWNNGNEVILYKDLSGGHLEKWRIARLYHIWRTLAIDILFLYIFTISTIYDTASQHYNCHEIPYAHRLSERRIFCRPFFSQFCLES